MQRFKNILVAVDLSSGDHLISSDLTPPTIEAIERAVWLSKLNDGRLRFFCSLDVCASARRMIEESGNDHDVLAEAREVLAALCGQAVAAGVDAETEVQFGKSWIEIIQCTIRNSHDLVVAGTRHLGAVKGFLMGSTGIKLLRKCPCPVWITQPQENRPIKSILVAHCLSEVGDAAMELGCSMAELHGAQLRVLHALEIPEYSSIFPSSITSGNLEDHRATGERHISKQLAGYEFAHTPQISFETDAPDHAVLEHIQRHHVELVVMGTVARTGIAGLITGNTAERLLPQISCSVLAVKPRDFVSPVSV